MAYTYQEHLDDGIDQLKKQGSGILSETSKTFTDVGTEVKHLAKLQVEKQKDRVAEQLSYFGRTLRSASEALSKDNNGIVFGDRIIDKICDVGEALRAKDVDQLLSDTSDFARARPLAYLFAAAAVGFIAVRFIKSSTDAAVS